MTTHVYCALCGIPTGEIPEGFGGDQSYDPRRLYDPEVKWSRDVKLLGQNPASSSSDRIFVVENAVSELADMHFYTVKQEEIPFPLNDRYLIVYDWDAPYSVVIPYHTACFKIIEEIAAPHPINHQVLYETLKPHLPKKGLGNLRPAFLDLNYGEACEYQEQKWLTIRGAEVLMASPVDIPDIEHYMNSFLLDHRLETQNEPIIESSSKNGSLTTLPSEVLSKILLQLDDPSLSAARLASRDVAAETSTGSFWKNKVYSGMPWIVVYLQSAERLFTGRVDWCEVYQSLMYGNMIHPTGDARYHFATMAISNRYRIWSTCSQVLDEYFDRKTKLDVNLFSRSPILQNANSTPMSTLVVPESRHTESSAISLVNQFSDIQKARTIITTYWKSTGELAGISTRYSEAGSVQLIGSNRDIAKAEDVQLPDGEWLSAIIFSSMGGLEKIDDDDGDSDWASESESDQYDDTSKPDFQVVGVKFLFSRNPPVQHGQYEGHLRIIQPSQGHFVVGFDGSWGPRGVLEKFAILHHPVDRAPPGTIDRLTSKTDSQISSDPLTMKHLWKDELPPANLKILPCTLSQRGWTFNKAWSPMEYLAFGTCDEELAKLKAIGVDSRFLGIEIIYTDGTRRNIGPGRHAMQYYPIDGPGGERIVYFYAKPHEGASLRFFTNRNRYLIFGKAHPDATRFPSHEHQGDITMGIYCNWYTALDGYNSGVITHELVSIGAFSRNVGYYESHAPQTDSGGLCWNPSQPVTAIYEQGPVFGKTGDLLYNRYGKPVSIPSRHATVAWVDCGRPLKSIKVAMAHSTKEP
ncbi:hypothetical protein FOPG_06960 [Fusarium oxysporum f. sp. conglutinans race 2 54008]|nr:hypothetical protein FOPG_06960 [Fusarium oxysporum f. sp. conglutinans race 2 54008]KAG6991973.1 hypothetical protein FocnCong_v017740 [Fusarium oxysporum f. sp. conglutinans]